MAKLKVYIPDSQFEEGGKFEQYASNRGAVQVLLTGVLPVLQVTHQPKFIEEHQFQPQSNRTYRADLDVIQQGLIVVEKAGVPQTPEDMTIIFRQFFQEL